MALFAASWSIGGSRANLRTWPTLRFPLQCETDVLVSNEEIDKPYKILNVEALAIFSQSTSLARCMLQDPDILVQIVIYSSCTTDNDEKVPRQLYLVGVWRSSTSDLCLFFSTVAAIGLQVRKGCGVVCAFSRASFEPFHSVLFIFELHKYLLADCFCVCRTFR